MTIKIEREALQCITNDTHQYNLPMLGGQQVDHIPESRLKDTTSCPELDLTECDDNSSVSSFSFSSSTTERSVTWSNPLVSEVRYRPRTKTKDLRRLFYSYEQTQRFRQEYRLERRKAAEEDAASNEPKIDTDKCSVNSHATPWSCSTRNSYATDTKDNCTSMGKHRISRVVVMHKNNLTTYDDSEGALSDLLDSDRTITGNTSSSLTQSATTLVPDSKTASNHFFDNDNFWSGQITWY